MEKISCCVLAVAKYENKIGFVPINFSMFIMYDYKLGKTIVFPLEKENIGQKSLYSCCVQCGEKAVFIPLHGKHFLIVDMNTCELDYIDVPLCNGKKPDSCLFSKGYYIGDFVYAIGYQYPGIVKINIKTKICESIELEKNLVTDGLSYSNVINDRHEIIMVTRDNIIIRYSVDSNKVKKIRDFNSDIDWNKTDRTDMWLTNNVDGMLFRYISGNGEVDGIKIKYLTERYNEGTYRYAVKYRDKLLILPEKNCPIIVYDIRGDFLCELWINREKKTGFSVEGYFVENGLLYIADDGKKSTYIIDEELNVREMFFPLDRRLLLDKWMQLEDNHTTIKEGLIKVDIFLSYI